MLCVYKGVERTETSLVERGSSFRSGCVYNRYTHRRLYAGKKGIHPYTTEIPNDFNLTADPFNVVKGLKIGHSPFCNLIGFRIFFKYKKISNQRRSHVTLKVDTIF